LETFKEFAERWSDTILPLKKPASRVTMGSHIKILNNSFGSAPLAGLEYATVQKFFSTLAKNRSPKTVKNIFGTFRNLMGQAQREKLIEKYPIPVLPKMVKTQQDWLTLEQMRELIACSDVNKPLVALLCETGLRVGEALGLQTQDVDFYAKTLTVNRSVYGGESQTPKTTNAYRSMCISQRLSSLLHGQSDVPPSAYIFRTTRGGPAWPGELRTNVLDPLARSLGIKPVGYHAYRRGSASMYASDIGMPEKVLSHRMGHAGRGLTLGLYAQSVDRADVPYVERAARLLYGE